ncbi:MAG TPA: prepilin-type N-terminal cleavage/methylation domain-containing protein [Holophagaceae bacterium]|nr:prepilin-type N-terminal cleavage/methylation domain-containing protein [Holophagaceae bacterium]
MDRRNEKGFSLLELLVAMMIIAVLGTLGFTQVKKHSANARQIKAKEDLKMIAQGLDQYYLRHGRYPDFGSVEAMVDANSVLVKEDCIRTNLSAIDPFGSAYEGKSNRGTYELKCQGDPNGQEERGPFSYTPGQMNEASPTAGGADKAKADAGAPK